MKHLFTHPLRNRYLLISDVILLAAAAYFSYVLRFETFDLAGYWPGFLLFTGLALVVLPLVFVRAGIYTRYWRYASVEEVLLLAGSATVGVLLTGALSLLAVRLLPGGFSLPPSFPLSYLLTHALAAQGLTPWTLPRSIPLIFLLLALVATTGPRLLLRVSARSTAHRRSDGHANHSSSQPVLIMGAGDAGAMILRELQRNPHLGLEPIGFLDDDMAKHEVVIHGVPVLGNRHAIPEMVRAYKVRQIIIAMPTAAGEQIRDIVHRCAEAGVQVRIMPGIYELLDGTVSVKQLRDVRIEDLLRREPVHTDTAQVEALLRGRRVLVTGAGGSIGSELCRQIARCDPAEIVLLGHGENSVFDIYNELRGELEIRDREPSKRSADARSATAAARRSAGAVPALHPVIADIRFDDRLQHILEQFRSEIVFHAAAHKHVPLMESNVEDAVTNNVLGTKRLVDACVSTGVTHFVLISTDKAVNPVSIMGATKRVAEMVVQEAARRTGRCFVAVRFGNVLGSRGSVVPYFQKQIAAGGPVTVTHPEMRRYFMTIPEAVQLVLQAAALGRCGELFVLDMGEPVRILDLARDLIRLSGLEPDHDIGIQFTGLRPGERLSEDLFGEDETYRRTRHDKIFVCRDGRDFSTPDAAIQALVKAAERGDVKEARRLLHELVPEYGGAQR